MQKVPTFRKRNNIIHCCIGLFLLLFIQISCTTSNFHVVAFLETSSISRVGPSRARAYSYKYCKTSILSSSENESSSSMMDQNISPEATRDEGKEEKPSQGGVDITLEMTSDESGDTDIDTQRDTTPLPYNYSNYYEEYEKAMEQVLQTFRVAQKKDTEEDLQAAKNFLFSPKRFAPIITSVDMSSSTSESESAPTSENDNIENEIVSREENRLSSFRKELLQQKTLFLEKSQMTSIQIQIAQRALAYMGDYCAKKTISLPLHVAWDKIKEVGMSPRDNTLSAYLYRLSSIEEGSDGMELQESKLVPQEKDDDDVKLYDPGAISGQVAYVHDLLYQPTENTAAIQIKTLVDQGKAKEAEDIVWKLSAYIKSRNSGMSSKENNNKQGGAKKKSKKNEVVLKLRTCEPVLNLYCEMDDASSALNLYRKMKKEPSIHFDAETYALLLSSLARMGNFRQSPPPLDASEDMHSSGAKLFDEIATDMAGDIFEISCDCATKIRNGFAAGFSGLETAKNLSEVPYDCALAPVKVMAPDNELVACRVTIDPETTLCPRTNTKLRLILLDEDQKDHVHRTLQEMSNTQYEAYENMLQQKRLKNLKKQKGKQSSKAPPPQDENYAKKHIEGFTHWLNDREGEPFTAIVDGANVAYYGLGSVNFHHIDLMVKTLEEIGEKPLVIMPQKYAQKKFYLRQGYVQELPESQMKILEDLEENNKIYKVPHRCLDDYYWMIASVSKQEASRKGVDLDVPLNNEEGRWPGTRPMLMTNDQMRDHKLELLEPRLFRRWCSSYIVNYDFDPMLNGEGAEREIKFEATDSFSREIQGNPSNIDGKDTSWHFPVSDWGENDRFCIRIPNSY